VGINGWFSIGIKKCIDLKNTIGNITVLKRYCNIAK